MKKEIKINVEAVEISEEEFNSYTCNCVCTCLINELNVGELFHEYRNEKGLISHDEVRRCIFGKLSKSGKERYFLLKNTTRAKAIEMAIHFPEIVKMGKKLA